MQLQFKLSVQNGDKIQECSTNLLCLGKENTT